MQPTAVAEMCTPAAAAPPEGEEAAAEAEAAPPVGKAKPDEDEIVD
jgi:hypothetical protein